MRVGRLILGLLGILAYVNRDRIGAFLGNMGPTDRRGTRQNDSSGEETPDGLPINHSLELRSKAREGAGNPVGGREPSRPDPLLESISGREDNKGAEPGFIGSDDVNQPVGAVPRSTITGRHDEGMDANETIDGLAETEELTRHLAEDTPSGGSDREEDEKIPVFERGRERSRI
ncbi:hypothetical protein SAZ10_08605 [Mesorhizobium sp. BAC0120]|uniref:hypothetical protein n=1 Tax=Mesorhizobium sp. BAC0120 TaxID=3090670 RepID=UPI00298C151D|nr:hypothetical protein [Mesorhizobium sp. BAC0120]MDW6021820.1 hypothetical protein [Mesorhizobium sp. BAC0120]